MSETDEQARTRPARGTRPANRRALIVTAASDLFYRNGYTNVGVGDVADAVAIGPSALYRHFPNKQDILNAVIADALATTDTALDRLHDDPTTDIAATLAATMLDHRGIGALWHREARYLDSNARTTLRNRLRAIASRLAALITRQRPQLSFEQADMLAWAVLGVATSVSFHSLELPREQYQGLLADMIDALITAPVLPLPATTPAPSPQHRAWWPSRRNAILTEATILFGERGYAGVATEDIGEAVGIAGPSIYNHFASKADILTAILDQGNLILQADLHRQLNRATGPADALHRILHSYTEFAFENATLIGLLTSDTDQLGPQQRHRIRTAQHDYITQWVDLLRQLHPAQESIHARIRVQAIINTINDIAATPHLHAYTGLADATELLATRVLELPPR
ncbi:TetR/AcrR family transcriptional regulator [Nocardia sp. NPDC101769]|uniref:TetR/AcrR family transcriptional regulator n=1 Tax=Nocardia sp. NPDC101769 TaxID=3364333 RepID=UPI00382CCE44